MIQALEELIGGHRKGIRAEIRQKPDDEYIPIVIFAVSDAGLAFVYVGSDQFVIHRPWHALDSLRVPADTYTTLLK